MKKEKTNKKETKERKGGIFFMEIIKKQKNSKGITLIALVISIIVLLILAGVSIATLTGENRNINKSRR